MSLSYSVTGIGSMSKLFFGGLPHSYVEVMKCDKDAFLRMFHLLLKEGVFLPPSQFETEFVSLAHTQEHIDQTLDAYRHVFKKM